MDVQDIMRRCRELIRIIDNYHIPEDKKMSEIRAFIAEMIPFEFEHISILDRSMQSFFDVLCKDIIRQCREFLDHDDKTSYDAKGLLFLILSVEGYLYKVEHSPWVLGRKISYIERYNIRRIFRKKLHTIYDTKKGQSVRGTRVKIVLTGSLARGHSDWKLIPGSDIPKPTDYNVPREFRKATKSTFRKLDAELTLPHELKPYWSDVDILIMSEIIFDSIDKRFSENGWSFKLGEKYPTGVGCSDILSKVHQSLMNTKIGGVKGRWVNYIVIRDQQSYERYFLDRQTEIGKLEKASGKRVDCHDVLILDEIIR